MERLTPYVGQILGKQPCNTLHILDTPQRLRHLAHAINLPARTLAVCKIAPFKDDVRPPILKETALRLLGETNG